MIIKNNTVNFSISLMCRLLGVSTSGYYAWLSQPESKRARANRELATKIKLIYEDEKSRAGAPRITKRLQQAGYCVGKNRVARIMRAKGWRAKAAKKYKATTNSNHQLPVSDNLLAQDFSATEPDTKWVSDITYSVPGVQHKQGGLN